MNRNVFALLMGVWISIAPIPWAWADDVQELEVEIVTGQREKAKRDPDVFDPLSDPRWIAGFRETFPTAIPEELKGVDALTRTREMKRFFVCADGWYYPFSHTAPRSEPPGIDIEIVSEIAKRHGWKIDMVWASTNINLDVAFRRTIDRRYCDIFMGLVDAGEGTATNDALGRHDLVYTRAYMGLGFVLAVQGKAAGMRTLEEVKQAQIKVGVPMLSPIEFQLREQGVRLELYFQNQRVIEGMLKHEVDAGMVLSSALSLARKIYRAEFRMVSGYAPQPGQRWNAVWAVPLREKPLKEFLDKELEALLREGAIKQITEKYDVPFFPPWDDALAPSAGSAQSIDSRALGVKPQ